MQMSVRNKDGWESAILNNKTFDDYYNRIKEIALSCYEWAGLPDTADERFLEKQLFEIGQCIFFKDEFIGYLTLGGTVGGRLDVYGNPIIRTARGINGYQKMLTKKDSVMVFNNRLRTPSESTVRQAALRLYRIKRAIDVNMEGQKTPLVILTNDIQKLSAVNFAMKVQGNEPVIFANKNLDIEAMKDFDIRVPFVGDKLRIEFNNEWNEIMSFLGVENANSDKKERLVSSEVNANSGTVESGRNTFLVERQIAAEQINKMFGLNIEVKFRSDLITNVNTPDLIASTIKPNDSDTAEADEVENNNSRGWR